jgi:hypothetical protein
MTLVHALGSTYPFSTAPNSAALLVAWCGTLASRFHRVAQGQVCRPSHQPCVCNLDWMPTTAALGILSTILTMTPSPCRGHHALLGTARLDNYQRSLTAASSPAPASNFGASRDGLALLPQSRGSG